MHKKAKADDINKRKYIWARSLTFICMLPLSVFFFISF